MLAYVEWIIQNESSCSITIKLHKSKGSCSSQISARKKKITFPTLLFTEMVILFVQMFQKLSLYMFLCDIYNLPKMRAVRNSNSLFNTSFGIICFLLSNRICTLMTDKVQGKWSFKTRVQTWKKGGGKWLSDACSVLGGRWLLIFFPLNSFLSDHNYSYFSDKGSLV